MATAAVLAFAGIGCGGSENTGTTDGGAPPVTISPAMVAYPATVVGQASPPQTVTIRNDSSATLTKAMVALGGKDTVDFSLGTGDCGATLRREDSCRVTVTFNPKTPGDKTATLVYNANGGSKSINLTGTANTPAMLSISPADGAFGGVPVGGKSGVKSFLVKNEGSLATAEKPTISVAGEFTLGNNTCAAALPGGGGSCTVEVTFDPTSAGAKAGSLTAAAGSLSITVPLSGLGQAAPTLTVMPPSPIQFPDTVVGVSSAPITVTLTNTLGTPAAGFTFSVTSEFTATATCPNNTVPASGSCTINVVFAPRSAGALKGQLNVSVTGGVPTVVQLAGTGIRKSALVFAPASHNFANVSTGTTSGAVSFTLRNDGDEDATQVMASITGANKDDFALVNNCSATLRPGAANACTVLVSFKPTNLGVASATLTVTAAGNVMGSASLSGTGVPPATITVTPNTQDFGTVAVNASSAPVTFTIKNVGGASTGKVSTALLGDFRAPADANNCKDATLAPNATCTLAVIFSPSGDGAKTSTLTVMTEAAGTTSVSLTGTGLSPAVLAVSPMSGDFGSVGTGGTSSEVLFTVKNTGGSASGVVTVAPNSTQYQITSNGCANKTLAPGAECTVGVKFSPTAVGVVMDRLNATASPGGSTFATLMGAGTVPPTLVFEDGMATATVLAFGASNVGTETSQLLVFLRNTGSTPTGILTSVLGGNNAGDFSIVAGSNTCMAPLPAASICQLALKFKPTAAGMRTAVLSITSASGGAGSLLLTGTGTALLQVRNNMGVALSSRDFGELTAGKTTSETFQLYAQVASGTYTVNFDGGASNFAITGGTCNGAPLAANSTCTFTVQFQPQYPKGVKVGSFSATTSGGVAATLALQGTAIGPLSVAPSPHNFGTVAVGNTVDQSFVVTNNGPQNMNSVAVNVSGPDLTVVGDTCATAPPVSGGTCTITVRFVPTSPGEKAGSLTATGSYTVAGATETDVATVSLSGIGSGAAAISVAPATFDYGSVAVGAAPVTQTFTVTNGTGLPSSGGIAVPSISGAGFTLTRDGCLLADNTTRKPLGPGESCTFDVRFTPSSVAAASATVSVTASPGGTVQVPLSGRGLSALVLAVDSLSLDVNDAGAAVKNVLGQASIKRRIALTNRSLGVINVNTTLAVSSLVGATMDGPSYYNVTPDTVGTTPCGPTLAAGATCHFQIEMVTPMGGTAGVKKAVFQVTGATPATQSASTELTGTLWRDAVIEFQDNANRDFGSVVVGATSGTHTIRVRNTGGIESGPLQAFDLDNGFARSPASGTNMATGNPICTLGNTLPVDGECDILLQFTPASVGAKTSTLRVYVTGAGSATGGSLNTPNVRTLTGVGLAPASVVLTPTPVDFGTSPAGTATQIDRTINLTNSSGVALTVGMGDITLGGTMGFSIVPGSNCIGTVAAGVQCSVTVRFQPMLGQAVGTALDTLTIAGNAAALTGIVAKPPALEIVAPTEGANWGEALVGTASTKRVFTIRNTGDGITGSAPTITIGGAQASEFAVIAGDNTCTAALPGGGTCTVAVTLTPTAIGARAATIDATATGTTAATQVALAANGVLASAIQIVSINGVNGSSTTVAFGTKAVASESSIDVVIRNAVSAQRIAVPTFTLDDQVNYRYDTNPMVANNCATEIADNGGLEGGESCVLRVFFRPQVIPAVPAPNLPATLIVGGATTPLSLTLTGNSVSALSVAAGGMFANTAVGATSAPVTFTVTNSNDAGIGRTGQVFVSLTGADAGSFRIVSSTCAGAQLNAGASCTTQVVFQPLTAGAKAATLSVTASSTNGATSALAATATP